MYQREGFSQRVMALDVGERRIGVALSDELCIVAMPLTTIRATPRDEALATIAQLVQQHIVGQVVVGLPLTLRGDVGVQAQTVQLFVGELEELLGKPVHFFDERLTSAYARQIVGGQPHTNKRGGRERGGRSEKRREKDKGRIDEIAASIILQNYLDATKGGVAPHHTNDDYHSDRDGNSDW